MSEASQSLQPRRSDLPGAVDCNPPCSVTNCLLVSFLWMRMSQEVIRVASVPVVFNHKVLIEHWCEKCGGFLRRGC